MKQPAIAIVDYDAGNTESVSNAFFRLGYKKVKVTDEKKTILDADAIVLPGVGAFDACAASLREKGLFDTLDSAVVGQRLPILGICVGMQLMAESSQENGNHTGFGWIEGKVVKIDTGSSLPVPHVGWNNINITGKSAIFETLPRNPHFFFDHSYHFLCDANSTLAGVTYGTQLTAAVQKNHVVGVQFHPEKSQSNGLKLIRAFCELI